MFRKGVFMLIAGLALGMSGMTAGCGVGAVKLHMEDSGNFGKISQILTKIDELINRAWHLTRKASQNLKSEHNSKSELIEEHISAWNDTRDFLLDENNFQLLKDEYEASSQSEQKSLPLYDILTKVLYEHGVALSMAGRLEDAADVYDELIELVGDENFDKIIDGKYRRDFANAHVDFGLNHLKLLSKENKEQRMTTGEEQDSNLGKIFGVTILLAWAMFRDAMELDPRNELGSHARGVNGVQHILNFINGRNHQGREFIDNKNWDGAIDWYTSVLEVCTKLENEKGFNEAVNEKRNREAFIQWLKDQENVDEFGDLDDKSREELELIQNGHPFTSGTWFDQIKAQAIMRIGFAQLKNNDFETAIQHLEHAVDVIETIKVKERENGYEVGQSDESDDSISNPIERVGIERTVEMDHLTALHQLALLKFTVGKQRPEKTSFDDAVAAIRKALHLLGKTTNSELSGKPNELSGKPTSDMDHIVEDCSDTTQSTVEYFPEYAAKVEDMHEEQTDQGAPRGPSLEAFVSTLKKIGWMTLLTKASKFSKEDPAGALAALRQALQDFEPKSHEWENAEKDIEKLQKLKLLLEELQGSKRSKGSKQRGNLKNNRTENSEEEGVEKDDDESKENGEKQEKHDDDETSYCVRYWPGITIASAGGGILLIVFVYVIASCCCDEGSLRDEPDVQDVNQDDNTEQHEVSSTHQRGQQRQYGGQQQYGQQEYGQASFGQNQVSQVGQINGPQASVPCALV